MPISKQGLTEALTEKVIPWWESNGTMRLITSATTEVEFYQRPVPAGIHTSPLPRRGKVTKAHRRHFDGASTAIDIWPDDHMNTLRFPILMCVLQGQADYRIMDYVIHCPQGHFILLTPGVAASDNGAPHILQNNPSRECEILHFCLTPGNLGLRAWRCYSDSKIHKGLGWSYFTDTTLVNYFLTFVGEVLSEYPWQNKLIKNVFEVFLYQLLRLTAEYPEVSREAPQQPNNSFDVALDYIHRNIGKKITVPMVAKESYMSTSLLNKLFHEKKGMSCHQYILKLKYDDYKRGLEYGYGSINSTAEFISMSPAHLRRLLKAETGLSPLQFRMKHHKNIR